MASYQTLPIDEISGEVRGSTDVFRKCFVRCWNVDGVSSLFFSAPHDEEMGAFVMVSPRIIPVRLLTITERM